MVMNTCHQHTNKQMSLTILSPSSERLQNAMDIRGCFLFGNDSYMVDFTDVCL